MNLPKIHYYIYLMNYENIMEFLDFHFDFLPEKQQKF